MSTLTIADFLSVSSSSDSGYLYADMLNVALVLAIDLAPLDLAYRPQGASENPAAERQSMIVGPLKRTGSTRFAFVETARTGKFACKALKLRPDRQRAVASFVLGVGRSVTLIVMLLGLAVAAMPVGPKPMPRLVWNASESAPIGLYLVASMGKLAVTNLVVATPPKPLARFLAERGYLPIGLPLIKRILALAGQCVCRSELLISVDGVEAGDALAQDRRGRPLPVWQGCRVIAPSEVFLMNYDEPGSFDGRYFGPIPLSAIVGRAEPVWTFAAH
ncbi:MAG TPA: S26 family signal peptidase [Xanthobacteraceae bacterium]